MYDIHVRDLKWHACHRQRHRTKLYRRRISVLVRPCVYDLGLFEDLFMLDFPLPTMELPNHQISLDKTRYFVVSNQTQNTS